MAAFIQRQTDLNVQLAAIEQDNIDGDTFKHIRIRLVDVDKAFDETLDPFDLKPDGGIFGLDLVHPNSNGYKLLANQYIRELNILVRAGKLFSIRKEAKEYKLK